MLCPNKARGLFKLFSQTTMPPNLNPGTRSRLPPLNNLLKRPSQPDDDPPVTAVRNVIAYEKEALVAHGAYWSMLICLLIILTIFVADNLLDDAVLEDAVVFKANVVRAKAGKGP